MTIRLKRAYEIAGRHDGTRILIDRVWPRGVRKADAVIDLWLKEIAPSTKLRKWFGHDPGKWLEFKRRYFCELDNNEVSVEQLSEMTQNGTVTLVFAARNEKYNNAVALKEYVEQRAENQKVGR
jgi:uncharacterized protein YeaO (DUF488 family)